MDLKADVMAGLLLAMLKRQLQGYTVVCMHTAASMLAACSLLLQRQHRSEGSGHICRMMPATAEFMLASTALARHGCDRMLVFSEPMTLPVTCVGDLPAGDAQPL